MGFVVGHALQWCSRDIEQRVEPRRAETYFDPVNPHIDPVDQGSEDSTPACCGELGPALSDLFGSRGKPPLGGRIREPRRSRLIDAAGIEEPLAHSAGHELLDLRGPGIRSPAEASVRSFVISERET